MPIAVIGIATIFVIVILWFGLLKRPIHEAMLLSFIGILAITNEWENAFKYIASTSSNTLFYAIVAFMVLAQIFAETKVVDSLVMIVLSVFGRFRGGAGYSAIMASTLMGALSGSGAGNVVATGVFTIPAMKKAGMPAFLAANVEMASSTMGNMIPPAGVITAAYGCYAALYPDTVSMSSFWLVVWGIAGWFILQRIVTLYVFCRYYNVSSMGADKPSVRDSLRIGGKNLIIPIVVFLPFLLDAKLKSTLFTELLGSAGASAMSSCVLLMTPGLAAIVAMLISGSFNRNGISSLIKQLSGSVRGIVPVSSTIFFAYCISAVFTATDMGQELGELVVGWNLGHVQLAFVIPLVLAILGMILPGSAQVTILGSTIVWICAEAGMNPLVVAAILPAMTGAMEGMTPPLALCMYAAMGIAGSNYKETCYNCYIWIGCHYIVTVLILLAILPVFGIA